MTMEERIARINALYHLSQERELSPTEKMEQTILRKEYIEAVRGNLRAQLDKIDIVEKDGSITNLGEKYGNRNE